MASIGRRALMSRRRGPATLRSMSIGRLPVRGPGRCRWSLALVLLAACGGGPAPKTADPETVARHETELLAPFETNSTVVADDLALDLTANFWGSALGLPALLPDSQSQSRKALPDGGAEYLFENRATGASMTFLLGSTQIRVRHMARVRVLGGKHDYTLDVDATGRVSVVDKDGRRDGSRFRVRAGKAELAP